MKKVIAMRGIPGSGKSTWVKDRLAREGQASARINNDDLCTMLFGQPFVTHTDKTGGLLARSRETVLRMLLATDHIQNVYIDNTNLIIRTVRALEKITHELGHEFIVDDRFLDVDVNECIRRDSLREQPVGEKVIRKMAAQARRLAPWPQRELPTIVPHVNDPSLRPCIIVDIDGTLADKHPDRNIYDYSKVWMDLPHPAVVGVVNTFFLADDRNMVIVMSGRDDDCRGETEEWLRSQGICYNELHMREAGDERPDWIVKHELFQAYVAGRFNVQFVLDDRDQVVNLWRRRLMLPTFQVADGSF